MEKKILQYSYWMGVLCVAVAVVWRVANWAGYYLATVVPGVTINYMSFFKGALLFLLIAIATGELIMATKPKE